MTGFATGDRQILDTIGNTPLVRLQRLAPAGVKLLAKLEGTHPGGSVKDRAARYMIRGAADPAKLERAVRLGVEKYCSVGVMLAPTVRLAWVCDVAGDPASRREGAWGGG